ncbi:MAG: hypothetical protein ABI361_09880 [Nitrososphaera sp.]
MGDVRVLDACNGKVFLLVSASGQKVPGRLKCRSCGLEFDSLGDLQKHILTEHHQKGDIP